MGKERGRGAEIADDGVSRKVSPAGKTVLAVSSFRRLGNAHGEERRADFPEDRAAQKPPPEHICNIEQQ